MVSVILFILIISNRCICLIDWTLMGTATPGLSEPRSNDNKYSHHNA